MTKINITLCLLVVTFFFQNSPALTKEKQIEYCKSKGVYSSVEVTKSKYKKKPSCYILKKNENEKLYKEIKKRMLPSPNNCGGKANICLLKSTYYIQTKFLSKTLQAYGISDLDNDIKNKESSNTSDLNKNEISLIFCRYANDRDSNQQREFKQSVYANFKDEGCNKYISPNGQVGKFRSKKDLEIDYEKFLKKRKKLKQICYSKKYNKIIYKKNCAKHKKLSTLVQKKNNLFIIEDITLAKSDKKDETKKKIKEKKSKDKKKYRYAELKDLEKKTLIKYEKLSKKIKIIKTDENSIELSKDVPDIKAGQYIAAEYCAKKKLFAYSFKDSGFGTWYEPPFKRAKFFYCTDQLIFVNPFTNKEVTWTNYDKVKYYQYPDEHLFLYREMRSIYRRALEKEKKLNPKNFKADPFKIVYKDENEIHIKGYPIGDLNRERYIANEHCKSLNKQYYFFEDSFLQGRFGTLLFHCSDKNLASNPLSGLPQIYATGSENYSNTSVQNTDLNASQMLKYSSTSNITYLYFEASDNMMKSLELLYRAYDQNVEADKLKAQISYNRESKYSEQDKLASTRSIIDDSSKEINAKLVDTSQTLTDSGRIYYQKSLPYAFNAAQNSYKLTITIKETFEKGSQDGASLLSLANEFIGFFTIAKDLPQLAKDIFTTSQLVFSGAKTKKIKDSENLGKALDDLELPI